MLLLGDREQNFWATQQELNLGGHFGLQQEGGGEKVWMEICSISENTPLDPSHALNENKLKQLFLNSINCAGIRTLYTTSG